MGSHRSGPSPGLFGQIDTARLVLYGATLLAGVASAGIAFVASQIQSQVEKVQRQVDDVPDQLRDATDGLQADLDQAGDRLTKRTEAGQQDLDRLTAALRALQGRPEEPVPIPKSKPFKPRQGPAAPAPTPKPAAATSAPQDPAAQVCEALKLQCQEEP